MHTEESLGSHEDGRALKIVFNGVRCTGASAKKQASIFRGSSSLVSSLSAPTVPHGTKYCGLDPGWDSFREIAKSSKGTFNKYVVRYKNMPAVHFFKKTVTAEVLLVLKKASINCFLGIGFNFSIGIAGPWAGAVCQFMGQGGRGISEGGEFKKSIMEMGDIGVGVPIAIAIGSTKERSIIKEELEGLKFLFNSKSSVSRVFPDIDTYLTCRGGVLQASKVEGETISMLEVPQVKRGAPIVGSGVSFKQASFFNLDDAWRRRL
jgi:hypothetical protein